MDLDLTDKVAVVTGASKGIGLAITRALVEEGALVVAGARTTESLKGLPRVIAMSLDLAASDAPAKLVERAIEQHGRLDVLVNNVGPSACVFRASSAPPTKTSSGPCSSISSPPCEPPARRSVRW